MIIGYYRVSTKNSFEERFSGAKERPIFNNIIKNLNIGDTLVVTKLDRFCRTVKEGLTSSNSKELWF